MKNGNDLHYITIPWWFSDFVLIKVRIMQLWIIRIDTRMYVSRKYHLCISIKNSLQRHIRLRCYLKWIKNSIDCNAIELLTCLCILPTLTEMKNDQINMSWAKKFIKIVEFELNDIKMFQNIYVYSKCAKISRKNCETVSERYIYHFQ